MQYAAFGGLWLAAKWVDEGQAGGGEAWSVGEVEETVWQQNKPSGFCSCPFQFCSDWATLLC